MFAFAAPRPRRRPSLTPMIDVVFLLLVFFMLAARFGHDTHLPLTLGGGGAVDWQGPPRLVSVLPDGLRLNGLPVATADLAGALAPLMPDAQAPVLLRAEDGADLGRLVAVIDAMRGAGITQLVVVE
jgi:biopolymer transport protein ExbD